MRDTPGHKYFQLLDGRGWAEDSVRVISYPRTGASAPTRISSTSQPPVCSGFEPSGASVAEPGEEGDAPAWVRLLGPAPSDLVWVVDEDREPIDVSSRGLFSWAP